MKTDPIASEAPARTARTGTPCCALFELFLKRLHGEERGTISILTVVALMMFTILLGMVVNVGRHVDDKIKQQNAADAGTLSGGVVLARGMNSLAFSNHLLFDVFALTAFMREGRDRNSEALSEDALGAWTKIAPILQRSQFQKFKGLGSGIQPKVDAEREMVRTFSEFAASISKTLLPSLETILSEHRLPLFQRALVQQIPGIAQQVTGEVARRHGLRPARDDQQRGQISGVLWRLNPQYLHPAGQSGEDDPAVRTLPVVDPAPSGADHGTVQYADDYFQAAKKERKDWTENYLRQWNNHIIGNFNRYAQMSQFFNLWEHFTFAQLCKLLNEEYPDSNLPYQIRRLEFGNTPDEFIGQIYATARMLNRPTDWQPAQRYLEYNFRFAGTTYRAPMREMFGKLFKNQITTSAMTFSEVALFIPYHRWWHTQHGAGPPSASGDSGGLSGVFPGDPGATNPPIGPADYWSRDNWPQQWSLISQNWTAQLVPATADGMPQILQSSPGNLASNANVPNLGAGSDPSTLRRVNSH